VNIYINDSKCAPKPAVEAALWQVTQPMPAQAILGAGCSGASMQSQLVLQVFEVPQVCYGSTNPSLGDKDMYPYFLRTIPSDNIQVRACLSCCVLYV
jgi:ABC-type branched-subunit amino acid transport system substrate-binding protein